MATTDWPGPDDERAQRAQEHLDHAAEAIALARCSLGGEIASASLRGDLDARATARMLALSAALDQLIFPARSPGLYAAMVELATEAAEQLFGERETQGMEAVLRAMQEARDWLDPFGDADADGD